MFKLLRELRLDFHQNLSKVFGIIVIKMSEAILPSISHRRYVRRDFNYKFAALDLPLMMDTTMSVVKNKQAWYLFVQQLWSVVEV